MNTGGGLKPVSRKLKAKIPGDFQQEVGCEQGGEGWKANGTDNTGPWRWSDTRMLIGQRRM